jgi:hypothetical protein
MESINYWSIVDGRVLLLLVLTIGALTYYRLNDDDESSIALDESSDGYDDER